MPRFAQRQDNEWFRIGKKHRIRCCDCGLVHVVEFRMRDGQLFMRAARDNRATVAARRWRTFACR